MSDIIKDLEADHQIILAFVNKLENKLITFMEEDIFDYQQMEEDISFIREFADKEHHQREEKILFKYMIDHLGKVAENLVRQGMIVEHDLARLYVKEWDAALQRYHDNHLPIDKLTIISYAHSYCMLLKRHIEKEDTVVYPFAKKNLSTELFDQMIEENKNYK